MPAYLSFFLHDKDVSIIGHDAKQNAVDKAELIDFVIRAARHGVCAVRVCHQELLLFVKSVQHYEMTHRVAVNVVKYGLVFFIRIFAGGTVKVGGAQTAKYRNPALEIAFEHAGAQVCCSDSAAQVYESNIGVNCFLEFGSVFCLVQGDELFAKLWHLELAPCRVKNLQVVRINWYLESALEGIYTEENAECTAFFQKFDFGNQFFKGYFIAKVGVNSV